MNELDSQLPDTAREDAASLVCAALGYIDASGTFHEPDESFYAVIYAAVDGDQDAVEEIAAIGRSHDDRLLPLVLHPSMPAPCRTFDPRAGNTSCPACEALLGDPVEDDDA